MKWSDRMLRRLCVGIGIAIVGWSMTSVGCALKFLTQPGVENFKTQTIEDPDWDWMQTIEDPDWDSYR